VSVIDPAVTSWLDTASVITVVKMMLYFMILSLTAFHCIALIILGVYRAGTNCPIKII
jgi:hypothetical protein